MADLSTAITVLQNIVTAINNASQTYLNVNGVTAQQAIAGTVLLKSGAGRVATVSITTAGSAAGTIYDTNSAANLINPIYAIPNTVGVFVINLPVSLGIVVVPGSGQVVTVGYT